MSASGVENTCPQGGNDVEEVEDGDIPDRATCQERCAEFASITGTDEACAQFFLQDHDWDLQRSLNSYFEARTSAGVHVVPDSAGSASAIVTLTDDFPAGRNGGVKRRQSSSVEDDECQVLGESGADGARPRLTTAPPRKFSFITWNVDGLNRKHLKIRTKTVCKIIEIESPDIVFLQELIPATLAYFEGKLPQYQVFSGDAAGGGYFTATLLRKYRVYPDGQPQICPFQQTHMGRNLLSVQAHMGSLQLTLLNTHLESTKDFAAVRKEQLTECFRQVSSVEPNRVVLLAGDLNLRDSELSDVGGLPAGVCDLWERCGRRPEAEFTWDSRRNANIEIPGQYRPRLRFDRVYLRDRERRVSAQHFGLVGLEKVQGTQCFPSDHWGVQVFFNINTSDN